MNRSELCVSIVYVKSNRSSDGLLRDVEPYMDCGKEETSELNPASPLDVFTENSASSFILFENPGAPFFSERSDVGGNAYKSSD